jgi:hypothetical protein
VESDEMIDKKPGRGSDQFPLRLPDGMRGQLKEIADAKGRSMNTEIVLRLHLSLLLGLPPIPADLQERIESATPSDRRQGAKKAWDAALKTLADEFPIQSEGKDRIVSALDELYRAGRDDIERNTPEKSMEAAMDRLLAEVEGAATALGVEWSFKSFFRRQRKP